MPFPLFPKQEAIVRFVGRLTVCSELREKYTGQAFDTNLPKYFASSAFTEDMRTRLGQFLKNEEVRRAMETINKEMRDFKIKEGCPYRNDEMKPYVFWQNVLASLLILGSFGWMTARSGFDPVMLLGIVPALVIFVYAVLYDWL